MASSCRFRIDNPLLFAMPLTPAALADRPWETSVGYPCVLFSAATGKYRMWYHVHKEMADRLDPTKPLVDGFVIQSEIYLCYAESADGLQWIKPELNRLKVKEYGPNNIVMVDSGFMGGAGTVIEDEADPDPALAGYAEPLARPAVLLATDLADPPTLEIYAQNAFHH